MQFYWFCGFALGVAAALAYGWLWSGRAEDAAGADYSWRRSIAKTAALAPLGVVCVVSSLSHGAPHLAIGLGLCLGALGDWLLSRPGTQAFLAGMAAFALGHLAYVLAFLDWGTAWATVGGWAPPGAASLIGLCLLGGLLLSTERWLAPLTGALRWPVRGYVLVIGLMAAVALLLPAMPARPYLLVGVALFVASDLLLALRLFVLRHARLQHVAGIVLWPAYVLGQMLIAAAALWIAAVAPG